MHVSLDYFVLVLFCHLTPPFPFLKPKEQNNNNKQQPEQNATFLSFCFSKLLVSFVRFFFFYVVNVQMCLFNLRGAWKRTAHAEFELPERVSALTLSLSLDVRTTYQNGES